MTARLEFAIGPVQRFVAQSRRTRDLWGSSYLLSFVAAHAVLGASRVSGVRIVHPLVRNDPMFRQVSGRAGSGPPPVVGSIPNRFAAEVEGDPAVAARAAEEAFRRAWARVCDAVWERFVAPAEPLGAGTRAIWDRQVRHFWEVVWAAGATEERGLLARRKLWRSHLPPDEPGDPCTVMPQLQELSGYVRARGEAAREAQDKFWAAVRARTGPLDLREDERLSAIALVKRLYPRVSERALGWKVDRSRWPSVAYVAAVPWIREVVGAVPEKAEAFAAALRTAARDLHPETVRPFDGISHGTAGGFAALDAAYLHAGFLEDERLCPLAEGTARQDLVDGLRDLYRARGPAGEEMGPPSSYYAVLLADGDRLGRVVRQLGSDQVGRALGRFTARVEGVVREHDGVTVYAGGDDVLALLPVRGALPCAAALERAYVEAFDAAGDPPAGHPAPTLSAAVVFAHLRLALTGVIAEAHRLLDEVAKGANGRDSLAVGVLRRGGLGVQWVSAWSRPAANGGPVDAVEAVTALARALGSVGGEAGLSSSLLYRLHDALALLAGWPRPLPGVWGEVPAGVDLGAFLRAEIAHALDTSGCGDGSGTVDRLAETVLAVLGRVRAGEVAAAAPPRWIGVDALLLARFLAGGGREDDA